MLRLGVTRGKLLHGWIAEKLNSIRKHIARCAMTKMGVRNIGIGKNAGTLYEIINKYDSVLKRIIYREQKC